MAAAQHTQRQRQKPSKAESLGEAGKKRRKGQEGSRREKAGRRGEVRNGEEQPKATPSATHFLQQGPAPKVFKAVILSKISLAAEDQTSESAAFGKPIMFYKKRTWRRFVGHSMVRWEGCLPRPMLRLPFPLRYRIEQSLQRIGYSIK